jgi:hypothetical protein
LASVTVALDVDVDVDVDVKGVSMPRKTHFEQVPVAIAEKAAKAESNGHSTDLLPKPMKKGLNGKGVAGLKLDEDQEV